MKCFLTKKKNRIPDNNKGATLISVIIVIGVVAVFASILLSVSLTNLKMKQMNALSKDTFYSAEQALDEINLGLQVEISNSMSSAYLDVMENYSAPKFDVVFKNEALRTSYFEYMWKDLEIPGSNHTKYNVDVLISYLKESTRYNTTKDWGAIVKSDNNTMESYQDGIVLKNIAISYKDTDGYVSVIHTDIKLAYPNFDFASSTLLPDIVDYSVIADGGVVLDGAGKYAFSGNIYADSIRAVSSIAGTKAAVTHSGKGRMVIKNALELTNASFSNEIGATFWADDINAKSSNVTLLGTAYVKDDLSVSGQESNITLGGVYNGFGNDELDAGKSSALLIGGKDTTIDLSALERITLAGHAYIGTKKSNVGSVTGSDTNQGNDIRTGESIAIKSNQLMYLVPPECIGILNSTGESIYHKNPLTAEEYAVITGNPSMYTEVSNAVAVSKLGGLTLDQYMELDANGVPKPEKVFVKTNGGQTLVYYYIRFKDETAANAYSSRYYNLNKETIDSYNSFYTKDIIFPDLSAIVFHTAGNSIKKADGEFEQVGNTVLSSTPAMDQNKQSCVEEFTALCSKLVPDVSEISGYIPSDDTNQVVYDNLVNDAALDDFIAKAGMGSVETIPNADHTKNAVVAKGDYTIVSDRVHLVIATGNVTVNIPRFNGLILCDGTITVANKDCKIVADSKDTQEMLRLYIEDGTNHLPVGGVLFDGDALAFTTVRTQESQYQNLSDYIEYLNWSKE